MAHLALPDWLQSKAARYHRSRQLTRTNNADHIGAAAHKQYQAFLAGDFINIKHWPGPACVSYTSIWTIRAPILVIDLSKEGLSVEVSLKDISMDSDITTTIILAP